MSDTFISIPYTGMRPDLLTKHALTTIYEESAATFHESHAKRRQIEDVIEESETLTVEGTAFCDVFYSPAGGQSPPAGLS